MPYKIHFNHAITQTHEKSNNEFSTPYSLPASNSPNHTRQKNKTTSTSGLPDGWTRATFILREKHMEHLKSIAYWDRVTLKEIIDDIVSDYLFKKQIK